MHQKQKQTLRLLLAGLAAGDSAGSSSEFLPQSEIPALYAKLKSTGWPFKQVGGGPFGWKPGEPTDDTDMAMCIVRSFLKLGKFDGQDVAKQFVAWKDGGPRDIGGTTAQALASVSRGTPWYEGGLAGYQRNPSKAANGSLMRNGVVAAMAGDLDEAFRISLHHGIITHYAPLPVLCCALQTYWTWELLAGRWPFGGDGFSDFEARWTRWAGSADAITAAWERRVKADLPEAWQTLRQADFDPDSFNPFQEDFSGRMTPASALLAVMVRGAFYRTNIYRLITFGSRARRSS